MSTPTKPTNGTTKAKERLLRHHPFLRSLAEGDSGWWNYSMANLTEDQLQVLRDVARNFLVGNVLSDIPEEELRLLEGHKHELLTLARKRTSAKKARRVIKQVGRGIFGILIPTLVSLLSHVLARG